MGEEIDEELETKAIKRLMTSIQQNTPRYQGTIFVDKYKSF